MQQENDNHQGHHDAFFKQLFLQVVDGPLNEQGTVIDRPNGDPLGQSGLQVLNLLPDIADHLQGILTMAHDNYSTDDFPDAIPLDQSATQLRSQVYVGHTPQ